jgi:ribosomal protein S27E
MLAMSWAKWIVAFCFECVHRRTTWPQRDNTGLDYVRCLDCGRELLYSTQLMAIVSEEKQLKVSNSLNVRGIRKREIHAKPAA